MGFPDEDVFDAAINVLAFDHVADAQFFPAKNNDTGQEVFEHILECKTDGNGCKAQTGNDVGGRHGRENDGHCDRNADNPRGYRNQVSCKCDQRIADMGTMHRCRDDGSNDPARDQRSNHDDQCDGHVRQTFEKGRRHAFDFGFEIRYGGELHGNSTRNQSEGSDQGQ